MDSITALLLSVIAVETIVIIWLLFVRKPVLEHKEQTHSHV